VEPIFARPSHPQTKGKLERWFRTVVRDFLVEARAAAGVGRCAFALLLPPTRLEEVKRVADAGQIMPPKSTFFAPKVPTGVVLRPLDAPV